jgi:hypothetical protein
MKLKQFGAATIQVQARNDRSKLNFRARSSHLQPSELNSRESGPHIRNMPKKPSGHF